ncbi:hypothetical protein APHAL10511_007387 [Amanita phalloides]|nr:hypothetical protein APHAL10511_007387 [Amanita phalloides]
MAPKGREHHARQAQSSQQQALTPELIAKRKKRHLEELERSNYSEQTLLAYEEDDEGGRNAKVRARQTISDKRNLGMQGNSPAATKKKSTMNVRTALLYRKSLAMWIEESNLASLPPEMPTYLTAAVPPSPYPPRLLCSPSEDFGRWIRPILLKIPRFSTYVALTRISFTRDVMYPSFSSPSNFLKKNEPPCKQRQYP